MLIAINIIKQTWMQLECNIHTRLLWFVCGSSHRDCLPTKASTEFDFWLSVCRQPHWSTHPCHSILQPRKVSSTSGNDWSSKINFHYTHKLRGIASKLTLKTAYLWHRFAPSVLTLRLPGSSDTTVLAYNVDLWTCRHAECPKWCQITIRDVGSTRLYTAYTVDTVYTFQNAKYWMGWTGLGGWIPQYTVITTRAPSVLIKDVSVFN